MSLINGTYNEATRNRPEGSRLLDAPSLRVSLPQLLRQLRSEEAWQKNSHNAITIFHNEALRVVLVALKADTELPSKSVEGALSIQVIEGRIWMETEEQSVSMDDGELVCLQPGVSYSLHSEDESVLLLSLSGPGSGY